MSSESVICICTMQVLVHAEYSGASHTASTSEMFLESSSVCNQTMILERVVHKQKATSAKCLNSLDISVLLLLVILLHSTIAKSQRHRTNSHVFPAHQAKQYKPTGSQPDVFSVTVRACCSLHLTVSNKVKGYLLVERKDGKGSTGHLCARGAQIY